MKQIKIGDKVVLKGNETVELVFAAIDNIFTNEGKPCIFLANDINNTNTYHRYSQQLINRCGYCI